jgi:hypothetical protein
VAGRCGWRKGDGGELIVSLNVSVAVSVVSGRVGPGGADWTARRIRLTEGRVNETASVPGNGQGLTYTPEERRAPRQLRRRYQEQQEEGWSESELARLRFLRWLYRTGRVRP